MSLAKSRDVGMVLLAGELFQENKPSRKSMYKVMRSVRLNCYGELFNIYHFNEGEYRPIPSGPQLSPGEKNGGLK